MNYKMVMKIIGNVLKYELGLLIIPIIISLYYKEAEVKSFIKLGLQKMKCMREKDS